MQKPPPPTLQELATLASRIHQQGKTAEQTASEALAIWNACAAQLKADHDERSGLTAQLERIKRRPQVVVPRPAAFPAKFDELLRIVVRGRDYGSRLNLFLEFLRDGGLANGKSKEQIKATIAEMKQKGFDESNWVAVGGAFMKWRGFRDVAVKRERAQKGAAKMWAKKGKKISEKVLGDAEHRQNPQQASEPVIYV